jgi:hypothetical protein
VAASDSEICAATPALNCSKTDSTLTWLGSPEGAASCGPASRASRASSEAAMSKALETLPGSLKNFYHVHRLELPTLSPDAEPGVEDSAPERRFMIDRLVPYPFLDLPRSEKALKERFGDESEKIGRIPWLVQEGYAKLVEAFKSGWVQLTADQQPFQQGYLPILNLCEQIVYGLAPINVDTGEGPHVVPARSGAGPRHCADDLHCRVLGRGADDGGAHPTGDPADEECVRRHGRPM